MTHRQRTWERTVPYMPLLVGIGLVAVGGTALASTGMPWESSLDTIANSITGKAGASLATISVAWTGINWGRGTEHGFQSFVGIGVPVSLIFGAATIANMLGGNASGATGLPQLALPLGAILSEVTGDLVGHLAYMAWVCGGIIVPMTTGLRWLGGQTWRRP